MNDSSDDLDQTRSEPGEVGLVEALDFVSAEPFTFDNGQTIPGFTLRYETYGRLNAAGDNAVFVAHALSGDHHAAGIHSLSDRKSGWWNNLIGPGKALDTNRYFVVCTNCLGGCMGSTGPSSVNPATGRPWGANFPQVTIRDMVHADKRLLDRLGVTALHALVGGSMGGMRVLQFGIEYPDFVRRLLPMATTARENAQAIAFNAVGREAIMHDPDWNRGEYSKGGGPRVGLAIARMMAHITYLSDASMEQKFGRRKRDAVVVPEAAASFDAQFEVERYLQHQGQAFINRFDANTYLYITRDRRLRSHRRLRLARAGVRSGEGTHALLGVHQRLAVPHRAEPRDRAGDAPRRETGQLRRTRYRSRPRLVPARFAAALRPRARLPRRSDGVARSRPPRSGTRSSTARPLRTQMR